MAKQSLEKIVRHLRKLTKPREAEATDRELLGRFIRLSDDAAFEILVLRHGPMVRDICRRLLGQDADAADAFQAVFLVLARKARSIRKRQSLASWLYGVAYRSAEKTKRDRARQRKHEQRPRTTQASVDPSKAAAWRELCEILDAELNGLAESYRAPLVLCYLESHTRDAAAQQLGWSLRTLERRLERGRELLRLRLARRGVTLSAAMLVVGLAQSKASATMPVLLVVETVKAATAFAISSAAVSAGIPGRAALLAEAILKGMAVATLKAAVVLVLAACILVGAGVFAGRAVIGSGADPTPGASQIADRPGTHVNAPDNKKTQVRTDRYGDPLPPGAIMRLGTLRLRHSWGVESIAFTLNGKQVVSAAGHRIHVWETATGKEVRRLEATNLMGFAISSPGGVLAAAQNGSVSVWDLSTWKPKFSHEVSTFAVAISPDGGMLASGGRLGASAPVTLWKVQTGEKLRSLSGNMPQVARLAFSPDGKTLAAAGCLKTGWSLEGSRSEIVRLWDLATGQSHELEGHTGGVTSLAYAPDGSVVATGGHDGTICLWDTATRKRLRKIKLVEEPYFHRNGNGIDSGGILGTDSGGILALAFAPNGQTIASANYDSTVRLFEVSTGKQLRILRGHAYSVGGVAFSPDGKILASGSNDQTIRLWDPASGELLNHHEGHDGGIDHVLISPDGKRGVSAGSDRTVRFWDVTKGHELRSLHDFKSTIHSVSVSPDGHKLAAGLEDGTIHLRDADSGAELSVLKGHTGQVGSVSFSPDGKLLASASPSGEKSNLARKETVRSLRLWDVNTGQELPRIEGTRNTWHARFSPDGKWLVAYTFPGGVDLWDPATGKKQRRLGDLEDFAFLPDSKTIAGWSPAPRRFGGGGPPSSGEKGMVRVRSLPDGGESYGFEGPEREAIIGGLFVLSPDGRLLALAVSQDGDYDHKILQLWEIATGKLRRTLKGHSGRVTGCAFSANGRLLLSASSDTTILVWDLAGPLEQRPQELTQKALALLWRDLGDADAARADQAIWGLVAAPQQALSFLQKSLSPTPAPDPTWLAGLVKDLSSDQFTARDKATRALEGLEEMASPVLNQALAGPVILETRRRIERLLSRLKTPLVSPKKVRELRAVEVLEHIGTPEARQVLHVLAQGAAGARLTGEAKASLERLTQSKAP
jgi:RNA polymerase sigma factor (sigma-70 family)